MTLRIPFFCAALLAMTAALAQDGARDDDDASEPREVDIDAGEPPAEEACFYVRDVRSFSALDDRYVYIEGARDEHYVLTMFPGCIGLESALSIAISNPLSRVCSLDTAEITYRGFANTLETCPIRGVEAVEDRAAAEALVDFRKRAEDRDDD